MGRLKSSDAALLGNSWLRIAAGRTMAARPERVWAVIGDETNWLAWYEPLSAFESIGEPTTGVGATFRERDWLWKTESRIVTKEPGREIGLSTESINMPGLLTQYYRRIAIEAGDDDSSTRVTITGAFRFGPLGYVLFPYTYPQMLGTLYVEYRSALKGLAGVVEAGSVS